MLSKTISRAEPIYIDVMEVKDSAMNNSHESI